MGILKCCGEPESGNQITKDGYGVTDSSSSSSFPRLAHPLLSRGKGGNDVTDKIPNSFRVTKTNLCTLVFSIILHCVDVGMDLYVAYSYFDSGRYSHGSWSLVFILVPSIVLASISTRMYLEDLFYDRIEFSACLWRVILCIVGLPIQSAPLIRTCDSLYFAVRSLKAEKQWLSEQKGKKIKDEGRLKKEEPKEIMEKYIKKMLSEDSDAAFQKVFEAYLESAPQQVLQMTLLIMDYSQGSYVHNKRQLLSIIFGFLSMAYCMANYNRCIRFDQENKQNVSISGFVVHFLWHLFFTVCRILTISALASLDTAWTCLALGVHWWALSIWLAVTSNKRFCPSNLLGVPFAFVVGLVYIFNFLNLKERKTKYYYLFFFLLCFVENTIGITIWGIKSSFNNWVYYFFLVLPLICFALSLLFMIVYYKFLHPSLSKSSVKNPRADKKSNEIKVPPPRVKS